MSLDVWKQVVESHLKHEQINGIIWVVSAIERPNLVDIVISQAMEFMME